MQIVCIYDAAQLYPSALGPAWRGVFPGISSARQSSNIFAAAKISDINKRKKTEDEIRFRASHDGLTGLSNCREFFTSLELEVRRADRTRQPFALLLLDLDDLKTINDRFGHLAGNRALNRLARVMQETAAPRKLPLATAVMSSPFFPRTPTRNERKTSPDGSAVAFVSKPILPRPLSALAFPFIPWMGGPLPNSWKPPTSGSIRARNHALPASPSRIRNEPSPPASDLTQLLPGCTRFHPGVNSSLAGYFSFKGFDSAPANRCLT